MELARTDFYLDGRWVTSSHGETLPVHNPATEEVIATVPAGRAADVDRAVA
ncbi:aldehyde dehydrogenase family protein, partial [Micromonospora azadirachtae]